MANCLLAIIPFLDKYKTILPLFSYYLSIKTAVFRVFY